MGKIVKYCTACDESFAEKFAFCPNCAQPMTAFEMNPFNGAETKFTEAAPVVESKAFENDDILEIPAAAPIVAEPFVAESAPPVEVPNVAETKVFAASNQTQTYNRADIEELESLDEAQAEESTTDDFTPETKTYAAAAGANGDYRQPVANNYQSNFSTAGNFVDDGYHITVIEEKNSKQRNGLLLGTMVVMVTLALGGVIYSIFNKDLGIGAIDSNNPVFLAVNDAVPIEVEEPPKPKNDDDGGGGGGGGKEEPEPPSKGRLVSQSEKPINPPDAKLPQLTNPELKIIQETQGKIKRPITEERAGLPGSDNLNPSNGGGRGGGIGTGIGTGIGGGNGTGEGNGDGSGSGNGKGNGTGNGTGDRNQGTPKPPPPPPDPKPVGPTEGIKILSKPQPRYTDAARTNNVQGTVTLKVTFSASGQVTGVAPVSGLPYGLTEQAIAAARQIRFEPPKRNGVPYSISKSIQYTFSIY
jgi:periplasmic protein TonB